MLIHPINNSTSDRNRYCGPAVISAITQMTSGEAAILIRSVSGQRAVRGTYTRHVLKALKLCGVTYERRQSDGNLTLARWLKEKKHLRTAGRVFLIVAGHHFQLVSGRRYVCGRTGEIVSVRDKRVKRRARVREVYELFAHDSITIPDAARKPKRQSANRSLINKWIKEYGFEVEYERDAQWYWVSMSNDAEDKAHELNHWLQDSHICVGLDEVEGRMIDMIEFVKEHMD